MPPFSEILIHSSGCVQCQNDRQVWIGLMALARDDKSEFERTTIRNWISRRISEIHS